MFCCFFPAKKTTGSKYVITRDSAKKDRAKLHFEEVYKIIIMSPHLAGAKRVPTKIHENWRNTKTGAHCNNVAVACPRKKVWFTKGKEGSIWWKKRRSIDRRQQRQKQNGNCNILDSSFLFLYFIEMWSLSVHCIPDYFKNGIGK